MKNQSPFIKTAIAVFIILAIITGSYFYNQAKPEKKSLTTTGMESSIENKIQVTTASLDLTETKIADEPIKVVTEEIQNSDRSDFPLKGLYVTTAWTKNSLEDYVWKSKEIDGVFERLYWSYFEPEPGKYDWTYLDGEFDKAIANNKKLSLGIMAGDACPEWMKTSGVPMLQFTEIPRQGKSDYVNNVNIPVAWNKQYLNYWNNFVTALSKHLQGNKDYWNTLTMIKVTGINHWRSDELRIPAEREVSNAKAKSTDAIKIWKQNNYKPQLVIDAFGEIMETFDKGFPGKTLCLPIIPGGRGIPAINDKGEESTKKNEDLVIPVILNDMTKKYGNRFMVMYEALTDKPVDGSIAMIAVDTRKKGAALGYQLCQECYKFPACLKTKTPCDNDEFYKVFKNGMDQGAYYFELYANDVKAYPEALKKAGTNIRK